MEIGIIYATLRSVCIGERVREMVAKVPFWKRKIQLAPTQIIALVFLAIILLGTILLSLPAASRDGVSPGFLPALFTATSSTCVTGLVMFDT